MNHRKALLVGAACCALCAFTYVALVMDDRGSRNPGVQPLDQESSSETLGSAGPESGLRFTDLSAGVTGDGARSEITADHPADLEPKASRDAVLSGWVRFPQGRSDDGPVSLALWTTVYRDVVRGQLSPTREIELSDPQDGDYPFEVRVPAGVFLLSAWSETDGARGTVLSGRLVEGAEIGDLELTVPPSQLELTGRFVGEGLPDPSALYVAARPSMRKSVHERDGSRISSRGQLGVRLEPDGDYRFTIWRAPNTRYGLSYGAFGRTHGSRAIDPETSEVELRLDPTAELVVRVQLEDGSEPASLQVRALQDKYREQGDLEGSTVRFGGLHPARPFALVCWSERCPPTPFLFPSIPDAQDALLSLPLGAPLSATIVDSELQPCGGARVRIVGGPVVGPPHANWEVNLLDLTGLDRRVADANGRFRYNALDEGQYTLEVEPQRIAPAETFAGLATGEQEHRLVLRAPPSGELAAEVVDMLTGAPLERFTVSASHIHVGDQPPPVARPGFRLTTARGEAVEMAAGDYGVGFRAPGYEMVEREVPIKRRQRTSVTVALRPASRVRLLVRDEAGEPVRRLPFFLIGPDGTRVMCGVNGNTSGLTDGFELDDQGAVVLGAVPAGWCQLEPFSRMYANGVNVPPRVESGSVWIPAGGDVEVTCTLATRDPALTPDAPAPKKTSAPFLVLCPGAFSSGEIRSFEIGDAAPGEAPLPERIQFEVRLPGGRTYSTSIVQRVGDEWKLYYSSATTSSEMSYGQDLGFLMAMLLIPENLKGVTIAVTSANGSAEVPLPPSWTPEGTESVLVLR